MHDFAMQNLLKRGMVSRWVLLTAVALLIGSAAGCGKRKPPQPPRERVTQRADISGTQRGNRINLEWKMPAHKAGDKSILSIDHVDIYRLAEPLKSSLSLTEEDFANRSTLIDSMPVKDTDYGKTLNYIDRLEFAGQPVRLRYAVRFVNNANQKAPFSNFLLIEPSEKVALNPTDLQLAASEDALVLTWTAPEKNINGSTPANIMGYDVFRRKAGGVFIKLNKNPVTKTEYNDHFFDFGARYEYYVQTVSLGGNAQPIDSVESETATITPRDDFAPSAPSAITIAAAPGNISIFFAANPEKDIAGYEVYRTEDDAVAKKDWKDLTPKLLQTNVFQDTNVESGHKYFYYMIAVDKAGNTSEMSEVVTETAP
jgi:hypothetical protein